MLAVDIDNLKTMAKFIYGQDEVSTTLVVSGESGIGKTEMVAQFLEELPDYEEVRVINVAHLNPEDMGIPFSNGGDYVNFKLAEIFKVTDPSKKVLILLDELNRPSSDSVGNFLMGAVCERRLFGKKISDNIRFAATLNPNDEWYQDTQDIFADLASLRRFNQVELRFDKKLFFDYSNKIGVDETLIDFLMQHPSQILVQGKINCPRQWHRFHNDILSQKKWKEEDADMLRYFSSLYMEPETCVLWMKFWEGNLEKFVQPDKIVENFAEVKEQCQKYMNENRFDMIEATSLSLVKYVKKLDSIEPDKIRNIFDYIQFVPRPQGFVLIKEFIPTDNTSDDLPYPIYNDFLQAMIMEENSDMADLVNEGIKYEESQTQS